MGKNITIQEGGTPRILDGVEKIVTAVVGGGTQNWIPEDEASNYVETGELTVSENGTYFSSDDGYVGYSKIDVKVTEGSRLIEKEITENGTYNASDDDADGYSKVEVDIDIPEPELITKSITENGTYNASDDDADGYSKIIVNTTPPITSKDYCYPIRNTGETQKLLNSVSGCIYNGKFYAFTNRTQMQCLENGVWNLVATLPNGIIASDSRLVVYNNELYLFGASNQSYARYNQTWKFNGSGFEKITEASGTCTDGAQQYSVYNGKVHFVGSASTSGGGTTHIAFDGTQWEDCPIAPTLANASAVYNNELYMFNTQQQKLYKFNGTSWAEVPNSVIPFKISNIYGLYEHKNKLHAFFYPAYGGIMHCSFNGKWWRNEEPFVIGTSSFTSPCWMIPQNDDIHFFFANNHIIATYTE